jgi:hypothetical protein
MKRLFIYVAIIGIAVVSTVNVNLNRTSLNESLIVQTTLSNTETVSPLEAGPGQEILKKPKQTCNCRTATNVFTGVAILSCEDYVWSIPMTRQTCWITDCSSGYCGAYN